MTAQGSPPRNIDLKLGLRQTIRLLVGVVAAAMATGITAIVLSSAWRAPIELTPNETVEFQGLRVTHLGINRDETLTDSTGEAVDPPPGSQVVVVRYRIDLTDPRTEPPVYCRMELTDGIRRWPPDVEWMGRAILPEAASCGGAGDQRLGPNQPVTVANVFVIPANAPDLAAEVSVGEVTWQLDER